MGTPSKSWLKSVGGTVDGSFFRCAPWVDKALPPGYTDQSKTLEGFGILGFPLRDLFTGKVVVCTPTFTFLCLSLFHYVAFSLDMEEAQVPSVARTARRFGINWAFLFAYYGFWHVATYFFGWSKRSFNQGRIYRLGKVLHNVFYFSLGVLQWTLWEAAFEFAYATGRLPYVSNKELFTNYQALLTVGLQVWLGFLWHELHFYLIHRMEHAKALYRYIHAVHHRNTDIEPFAGLSMHPMEHLYYFSSAGVCTYLYTSPFVFHYLMMLNVLAPAASHSGWEDHFQGDQMHYMHHRFFECNYGTTTLLFDRMFGTYRESLRPKSKLYKGEHLEVKASKSRQDSKSAGSADAKASLYGLPAWDEVVYNLITCMLLPYLLQSACFRKNESRFVPFLVAGGPILLSASLHCVMTDRFLSKIRRTLIFPFHKEKLYGYLGVHLIVGITVAAVPVYHTIETVLGEPGSSIYYRLQEWI